MQTTAVCLLDSSFYLHRLDRYVCYQPSWWRPFIRIHLVWFLRRYAPVFPRLRSQLKSFAGLTLGRVGLLWVNQKVRADTVVRLYRIVIFFSGWRTSCHLPLRYPSHWVITFSFCLVVHLHADRNLRLCRLELVIWLVPSLIGGAVAVSFVGVLLGPIYPIVMNHASRVLPPKLLTGSIGWIAGFGQAGSALLPFLTGALASRVGIKRLQPLYVYICASIVYVCLTKGVLRPGWCR